MDFLPAQSLRLVIRLLGRKNYFFTSENNFPKQIIRRKQDIGNRQKFEIEVYYFKYVSFLGKKILPKQSKWSRNVIKHLIYRIPVYLRRPPKYSKITKLLHGFLSNICDLLRNP